MGRVKMKKSLFSNVDKCLLSAIIYVEQGFYLKFHRSKSRCIVRAKKLVGPFVVSTSEKKRASELQVELGC